MPAAQKRIMLNISIGNFLSFCSFFRYFQTYFPKIYKFVQILPTFSQKLLGLAIYLHLSQLFQNRGFSCSFANFLDIFWRISPNFENLFKFYQIISKFSELLFYLKVLVEFNRQTANIGSLLYLWPRECELETGYFGQICLQNHQKQAKLMFWKEYSGLRPYSRTGI